MNLNLRFFFPIVDCVRLDACGFAMLQAVFAVQKVLFTYKIRAREELPVFDCENT